MKILNLLPMYILSSLKEIHNSAVLKYFVAILCNLQVRKSAFFLICPYILTFNNQTSFFEPPNSSKLAKLSQCFAIRHRAKTEIKNYTNNLYRN